MGPCIVIYLYSKTNQMHNFRVYWISLYMFRSVFPSTIRSSRLYIQLQVYVIQVRCLFASGHGMELHGVHSTCFCRSFHPSSGVQDCTYSFRYMSYSFVGCLQADTRWTSMEFHLVPACIQATNLYDIYLKLYVQSWTPDDGRKDRTKHVEWSSINLKVVHLVGLTTGKLTCNLVVSLYT